MLTSYLAPTERDWVEQDVDALPNLLQGGYSWPMLLASATSREQVEAIMAVNPSGSVAQRAERLYSIATTVGPDAAAPLMSLFDRDLDAATKKRLLNIVSVFPTDEAFESLVDRIDQKHVSPVVIEAMSRFPDRATRVLAARAGGSDAKARSCRELLRGHLISNPDLAARFEGDLGIAKATAAVPAADVADIPSILVTPPWEGRKGSAPPVVIAGLTPPEGLTLAWKPGEQQEWAQVRVAGYGTSGAGEWEATIAQAVDGSSRYSFAALSILAAAPPDLVRPHLETFTPTYMWSALPAIRRILGGVGDDAVAFTYRMVMTQPTTLASALLPIEGADVAARMAEWLVRSKSLRPLARGWLDRHPGAAARDLVPAALSKPGKERAAAETALRMLDQAGHRDAIREAAGQLWRRRAVSHRCGSRRGSTRPPPREDPDDARMARSGTPAAGGAPWSRHSASAEVGRAHLHDAGRVEAG